MKSETVEVFNFGIPGASSRDIIKLELDPAVKLKPDFVILLAGTNDMLNSAKLSSYQDYEKNMRFIISSFKKSDIKVLLLTLPPCQEKSVLARHNAECFAEESPNERIITANKILGKIAKEENIHLLDFFSIVQKIGMSESENSIIRNMANSGSDDGVHPTPEGYKILADAISSVIKKQKLMKNKIVCIGDSITHGVYVEGAGTAGGETYPGRLAAALSTRL